MDYYRILGVSQDATNEQIKAAYRNQVKQHHPDLGGDPEKFKSITNAYENLINNCNRNFPHNNYSQNFDYNPFQETVFENMFTNQNANRKNKDISMTISLDLKDIITGKSLILEYKLDSGNNEVVTIEVPPGVEHNSTIRYKGIGNDYFAQIPRGDLLVKVKIKKDSNWVREGFNLATRRTVNVFDLLLGCVILIETIDNKKVKLHVPKGTGPGTIMSIKGYGIPDAHQGLRGNLYVQIDCEIPNISDEVMLSKIQEIKDNIEEKQ